MTRVRAWLTPANRWLEPLFALLILASLVRAAVFLDREGYLPQPFFYDPADVWMDWFNTAYWAHNAGAYDSWGSVYPPLTFLMMRIFGKASCYVAGTGGYYSFRTCDWIGTATFLTIFVVNMVLTFVMLRKLDPRTAVPRFVALGLGLPMLFGLERANPFLACYTCVLLAFCPLIKSTRLRWLAAGMAVNFKPYLLTGLFPFLLRRRWRWFEGASIATLLVYLVSFGLYGAGSPAQLWETLTVERIYDVGNFLDLWFATTYQPLISLLNTSSIPITSIMGSRNVDALLIVLPWLIRITQATVLLAALAAWLRPEVVPQFRLTGFGISFAIISTETSGYSLLLILLFVFMERWEGFGRKFALVLAYVASIPMDIAIGTIGSNITYSYLSDKTVVVIYNFVIGPLVRPLMFMLMVFALACVTIRAVWIDIRRQGWKERWRFRHDLPILTGSGEVRPPA